MSFFDDHNDQLPADFEDNGHWANYTALKRRVKRETMQAIAELHEPPASTLPPLPDKLITTIDDLTPEQRIERTKYLVDYMEQHERAWAEYDDYRHT